MSQLRGVCLLTLWRPSHDIDSLVVLGESREVFYLAFCSIRFDFPDANVVVAAGRCKASSASWFKVNGVDGRVLLVPIDDERRCLHRDTVLQS